MPLISSKEVYVSSLDYPNSGSEVSGDSELLNEVVVKMTLCAVVYLLTRGSTISNGTQNHVLRPKVHRGVMKLSAKVIFTRQLLINIRRINLSPVDPRGQRIPAKGQLKIPG